MIEENPKKSISVMLMLVKNQGKSGQRILIRCRSPDTLNSHVNQAQKEKMQIVATIAKE
jgi:hypothetical protein